MIRGDLVGIRARRQADVAILHAELYDDVAMRARTDARPWRPVSPDSTETPYGVESRQANADVFTIVTLADDEVAGDAVLWGIDNHNRSAHVGLSLVPAARGRGYGAEVVALLCHYGFDIRGMHRLQVDTLVDNAAMIAAARKSGFVQEATLRASAWVSGVFIDEVLMGLLIEDWTPTHPR